MSCCGLRIADCGLMVRRSMFDVRFSTICFFVKITMCFFLFLIGGSRYAFAATDDIRDIRGPLHIPYPWLWIAYIFLGLIALTILVFLFRRWKNRPISPVIPPHQIALEKLEKALQFMESNQAREFSIAVSDAVRFYIEKRFHCQAAHRTTEEFLHSLLSEQHSSLGRYSTSLEDFLHYCDLAKFAREPLASPQMQSMYESAKRFVEETIPVTQPGVVSQESVMQNTHSSRPSSIAVEQKSSPLPSSELKKEKSSDEITIIP